MQGYIRARELSERIGDEEQLFVAVSGLANLYSDGSDLKKALEVGQELLRMALAAQEPAALLEAHSVVATIFHQLGDFRTSLEHANEGLKTFDPQAWLSTPFKSEMLDCFTTGAWDLLWLGYPDQSLARCDEALRVAREHGTLALARALFAAAVVHGYRGNAKAAQEQAETLLALARKNDIPESEAISLSCRGLALAMQGEAEEGLAECRRGLAIAEGIGLLVAIPFIETYVARLCWKSGKVEAGLEAVAKGQASLDRNGKDAERSVLYHSKGELLLMKEHNESAAEACFKAAIDIARSQQAKYWELSYTISLARLLARQGKRNEARAMLSQIYNWFTEGFETADLKDAKALLEELGEREP